MFRIDGDTGDDAVDLCFKCNKPGSDDCPLSTASTLGLDTKLKDMIKNIPEFSYLFGKISSGDMVAIETK